MVQKSIDIDISPEDVNSGKVTIYLEDLTNMFNVKDILNEIGESYIASELGTGILDEFSANAVYNYFGEALLEKFNVQELSDVIQEKGYIGYIIASQLEDVIEVLIDQVSNININPTYKIKLMELVIKLLKSTKGI
jgi:hypothetical protein